MRNQMARIGLGLALVGIFMAHAADWLRLPLVERLEAIAYDTRLRLTMPGGVDPRVVIVEPDAPLGKPGYGPESHPFLAPDAPGKDRMARPDPDPWRAPLGSVARSVTSLESMPP